MALWQTILLPTLAVATTGLAVWNYFLAKSLKEVTAKKEKLSQITLDDVEDVFDLQRSRLDQHDAQIQQLAQHATGLESTLQNCIQNTSVIRFNPFRDTGGDQSFAAALLDNKGNGMVVSSLHSRTGTRVYAKPIESGVSRFDLTDEELQSLARATDRTAENADSTTAEQQPPTAPPQKQEQHETAAV